MTKDKQLKAPMVGTETTLFTGNSRQMSRVAVRRSSRQFAFLNKSGKRAQITIIETLASINMPIEDWQSVWPFDFRAQFGAGAKPGDAAESANRFWWQQQNKSLKQDCRVTPNCWLPHCSSTAAGGTDARDASGAKNSALLLEGVLAGEG